MTSRASGTFEVKINPLVPYNNAEDSNAGRMSIDKQFQGDLQATSKGEMLTANTNIKGCKVVTAASYYSTAAR